ncbi:MAG: hypothetical protein WDN69_26160 [Aliidongia sp.]
MSTSMAGVSAANELLERATGRALDPQPYIDYLTAKYTDLYGVVPA